MICTLSFLADFCLDLKGQLLDVAHYYDPIYHLIHVYLFSIQLGYGLSASLHYFIKTQVRNDPNVIACDCKLQKLSNALIIIQ